MAPKGKKSKKQDDDWESEALGDTPDPIAAAAADAKAADAAKDDDEGEGGGGLMAQLKKNREKRAKKGKVVNDFVEGEDIGTDSPAPEPAQAEEANADDIFAEPVKGKGSKGKQTSQKKEEEADDDDEERGADGKVMTKKEKEKAKKEREKQRKKEQAAKKKATAPAKAAEPEKKEEKVVEKTAELEPAAATGKDGKKKKLPAHLAALQRQVEERKAREAEEARIKKEQEEAEAAAARIDEEQARKEAERKEARKQKEKEKKEELRKQGLLLTKAQKEQKAKAEQAKEAMLAAGMKVAGLSEPTDKKKPVYENKKSKGKGPSKAEEEARRLEEAKRIADQEAAQLAKEREAARLEEERQKAEQEAAIVPSDAEDWEAAADAEDDDDLKDSWDADTDEEAEKKAAVKEVPKAASQEAPKANGKPVNGTATKGMQDKQLPVRSSKAAADSDSDSDSSDETDSEAENQTSTQRAIAQRKAEAAARREKQREEAKAAGSKDNLRSPICCILGHVDTGKTKLLDKIRQTNVQEGEAGGITQQIGATFFPVEALQQKTAVVNKDDDFKFNIPGLLVIDTPGHESFSNLRSRGSSLCNIAILVVDIMHGLEPQTLESMKMLRDKKTPFIVALNKIDRLYGWKKIDNNGFEDSLSLQGKAVQQEFRSRLDQTKLAFAEQSFNAELFSENPNLLKYVSLVPTSAHTGEGIPDMIKLITKLTQERMTKSLMYISNFEATVLEVKVIEGLGTTLDVIVSNGVLREGDKIVVAGVQGGITTTVRALLTPAPLKELRVKSAYIHHHEVKASLGIKIAANDLEHAIAGSRLLVVGPDDDEEDMEEEVMADVEDLLNRVAKDKMGVSVQASTLGSLEALLEFLKVSKIPVANVGIGPVWKRDIMQTGVMLEKAKQYAVMLCFDVKVDGAAQAYADEVGIKIFKADIIYHLFDNFTAHLAQIAEQKKEESKMLAVFPCVLKTVAVFNKTEPIVVGVDVTEGSLRPLTPICAIKTNPVTGVKEVISLGRVSTIERDHKAIPICKKGAPSVAVKIEGGNQPMYGRQLEESDTLYSLLSRRSIDTLKEYFRSDVTNEEWGLIKKMKPMFDIA